MKIDLHCHTKKSKSGDPETREINASDFRKAIMDAGVGIVAITNHNIFDVEQYFSFSKEAKDDFQIWPGIELDVKGKIDNGHVVIVNNPKKVEEFDLKVKDLISDKTPDEVLVDIDELISFFDSLDAIILPHYKKPKSLDEDSIEKIRESVKEPYRFFYEPSNYRSMGILINHNQPSLVGSDVKDWSKYGENNFSELKLDVDTFDQFILLAKKDPVVVDTLLHKKKQTMIDIGYKGTGKNKKHSIVEYAPIYDDINIIFGTKGTGKSNVLEQIKKYYESNNIDFSYYTPSNTEDEISSKLKVSDSERMLSSNKLDNCSDEFVAIKNWKEPKIVQLKDYFDYVRCINVSKNKGKLKIINSDIFHDVDEGKLNKQKENTTSFKDVLSKLESIEITNYLEENDVYDLHKLLNKLGKNIYISLEKEWIDYESKNASNFTIETIKKAIEEKTETKTKPSKTGLFDFVNKRLELAINVNEICSGFNYSFTCAPSKIGELEENKTLYMVTRYKMLHTKSKTEEFTHNITELKKAKKNLLRVKECLFEEDINEKLNSFVKKLEECSIDSLDDFLGVKKLFTLASEETDEVAEYTPSTGEATMIILQEKLNDNKDVFILDEPEKSLGNTYVNDVIVPKLVALAKSKKVVIVVTHNANIAVRTFPYSSILKKYKNGQYETYTGNPFINKLTQIGNNKNCLNWKEESIKILEGGEFAFSERSEIYGRK